MFAGLRPQDESIRRRYIERGYWTDESVGSFVADKLGRSRGDVVVLHHRKTASESQVAVLDGARRFASALRARGVRPGDVVAFRLQNSVEAAVTFYGIALLGAIAVPIVPFWGRNEIRHVLGESGARVLVAGASFDVPQRPPRAEDFGELAPGVEIVCTATGERGTVRWSALLDADPVDAAAPVDPSHPALLAYTSGTTKPVPKGVVHSHQTLMAEVRQLAEVQPVEPPPIIGAPVGHAIGMLGALLVPIALDRSVFLADGWNPRRVLSEMLAYGVPAGTGSPYFLTSLLDHGDLTPEHLALIRYVGLGGASVPAELVERCDRLGISLVRMYGLTEHPSVTGASHDDPAERRVRTDGRPLAGVEVRIVDDDGRDLPSGSRGEVLTRGPDRCAGFVDPALADECIDADGWLHTGDVGVLTEDGWLSIVDRKKDLIIKGGENLTPAEIEAQVATHPDILEVAVVGVPDALVGERVCAFAQPAPNRTVPDLATLHRHLRSVGLAPQKWPDEIVAIDEFPRTPSGKIRKTTLREQAGAKQ